MAIEYTLLLKDKKLSEEILLKKIQLMGYSCNCVERLPNGGIAVLLYEQIGFAVFLFDSNGYPYNGWDSDFLKREFICERKLTFRWDKFYPDIELQYEVMLKIIFELMDELNEEALLLGSGSEEMCAFREDEATLLNNESGIWDRKYFKDIIADRTFIYG